MRVALCLSGHLRSYELTSESIQEFIIQPLSADVFIHTWDTVGISPHIDAATVRLKTKNVLKRVNSLLTPRQIIVEPINRIYGEKYRPFLTDKRSPVNITNMFYKIYKANELCNNYPVKYDLVIRARPDLMFSSPINMQDISQAITENCVFLPNFGHFSGYNDQFAFGGTNAMKIYSNCYNELDRWAPTVSFVPETLLKKHLTENNVDVRFTSIYYQLVRANGDVFDSKFHSPGEPNLEKQIK